jgi:hypothetical protein
MVLMTWGAHMNIQRVTSAAWSYYLLKYTLKVRLTNSAQVLTAACACNAAALSHAHIQHRQHATRGLRLGVRATDSAHAPCTLHPDQQCYAELNAMQAQHATGTIGHATSVHNHPPGSPACLCHHPKVLMFLRPAG